MPIIVNDVEISDDEVHAEMQHHPAATLEEARHLAAEALVVRQLLLQEAEKQGMLKPETAAGKTPSVDDEERAISELVAREVSVPAADEESCYRYYTQNQERFRDHNTGKLLPFAEVMPRISDYIQVRSLRMGIAQYVKLLAGRARIAGFDIEKSETPLTQ